MVHAGSAERKRAILALLFRGALGKPNGIFRYSKAFSKVCTFFLRVDGSKLYFLHCFTTKKQRLRLNLVTLHHMWTKLLHFIIINCGKLLGLSINRKPFNVECCWLIDQAKTVDSNSY